MTCLARTSKCKKNAADIETVIYVEVICQQVIYLSRTRRFASFLLNC